LTSIPFKPLPRCRTPRCGRVSRRHLLHPAETGQTLSWQTYWITQAAFCWFLLPVIGAMLTIPDLAAVLRDAPRSAMVNSFLLGAAYRDRGHGVWISIRYIGFSLTYAIAVGAVERPGHAHPTAGERTLGTTLSKPGAGWVIGGIVVGTAGIALTGLAGRLKEKDLTGQHTQRSSRC